MTTSFRGTLFLIGSVQFINILDFMIVMPLGPELARSLGIPSAHLGWIAGSYTVAAALAGILGTAFLDRFERSAALAMSMAGLGIATLCCALANGFEALIAARALAGLFGGPATSLSLAMIADVVPVQKRGQAMGAVMGAFAVAAVIGVPFSLEIARLSNWRVPFLVVGGLGLVITALVYLRLPRIHPASAHPWKTYVQQAFASLRRKPVWLSHLATFLMMMAGFMVIPNLAAFIIFNRRYPQAWFSSLYLLGGLASFLTTRYAGHWIDKSGAQPAALVGTLILAVVLGVGFILDLPWIPIPLIFIAFMIGMGLRNVAINTLSSQIPLAHERASYMSLQPAVKHLATSAGAFVAACMLEQRPDQSLIGMPKVAIIATLFAITMPFLIQVLQTRFLNKKALGAL